MLGAVTVGFALAAIVAGIAIAAQQLTNYGLRVELGSVWWAGFFSYLGGTLFMATALVLTRSAWPGSGAFARVELVSWIGGALGGSTSPSPSSRFRVWGWRSCSRSSSWGR